MIVSASRLLVVDDEPDFCANLSDILSDLGYRVDVAHCGRDAMALAREHGYAAALLDYRMPGMTGIELCKELKSISRGRTTPILLSAYVTETTLAEARDAGAVHFVTKPLDFDQLLPLIEQASRLKK